MHFPKNVVHVYSALPPGKMCEGYIIAQLHHQHPEALKKKRSHFVAELEMKQCLDKPHISKPGRHLNSGFMIGESCCNVTDRKES